MPPLETNTRIWNDLYGRNDGHLSYPDETLVRITHSLFSPDKHRKVLDYGFGSGANTIHLLNKGHAVSGVEVSAAAAHKLAARLARLGLQADLRCTTNGTIPFETSCFDAVIAWQVLYYNDWQTLGQALAEINRVLRPGDSSSER